MLAIRNFGGAVGFKFDIKSTYKTIKIGTKFTIVICTKAEKCFSIFDCEIPFTIGFEPMTYLGSFSVVSDLN